MEAQCHCTTLRAAARRVTALYDAALQPAAINAAQFALLRKLHTTGPVSIQRLAEAVELERSTVARNVRVLEKSGFVRLATTAADRRTTMIHLSPPGAEALKAATPLWESAQRRIEESLGVEGALALRETLRSL
ncbi:MarR family winged helix-turn-helix transcriptional regulator [Nonomuraea sp. NPDC059023]|uniref:MarR family winged helix-turn-helix transcriptional regulator n=1 Tax=unclassified Nonomuraea TaxID=2593643 RepID=UPI0036B3FBC1